MSQRGRLGLPSAGADASLAKRYVMCTTPSASSYGLQETHIGDGSRSSTKDDHHRGSGATLQNFTDAGSTVACASHARDGGGGLAARTAAAILATGHPKGGATSGNTLSNNTKDGGVVVAGSAAQAVEAAFMPSQSFQGRSLMSAQWVAQGGRRDGRGYQNQYGMKPMTEGSWTASVAGSDMRHQAPSVGSAGTVGATTGKSASVESSFSGCRDGDGRGAEGILGQGKNEHSKAWEGTYRVHSFDHETPP